jgi:phage tail protein X
MNYFALCFLFFSSVSLASGLENNIRFLSSDASTVDNIIEDVYLPAASYVMPPEGRLYTIKIDKNGDRLITAQVEGYFDDPSDLGCTAPADHCDFIVTDIIESSDSSEGAFELPNFGGAIILASALHPIYFNEIVGGCDVILEGGQSNSVGAGGEVDGVLDAPDDRIIQWTRAGQSSASSQFLISDGGVDTAEGLIPHQVGLAFTFAKDWLAYQEDTTNTEHQLRTGGAVRPVCIVAVGKYTTGHGETGYGYWGANYSTYASGGRADTVAHLTEMLSSVPNLRFIATLWSQGEWEARSAQGIPAVEAWPENTKALFDYLSSVIPELAGVPFLYFNATEACKNDTPNINTTWTHCGEIYSVIAGTYGGGVPVLEDIMTNAHYVAATSAPNGTGPSGTNLIHFTAAGQRIRGHAGFQKWLEVTGRNPVTEAVPAGLTLTPTVASNKITWSWPADTVGLPADTEYYLTVDNNSDFSSPVYGGTRCTHGTNCITGTSQLVSGLTNETLWYGRLQAVNTSTIDDGNAGGAGWGPITTASGTPFYSAPSGVTLSPASGAISVGWTSQTNSTAYSVQCSSNSGFTAIVYDSSGCTVGSTCDTASPENATGLTNGTAYWCRVRGYDGVDANAWGRWSTVSSPTSATPSATPDPAVVGLTATDGDDTTTDITWSSTVGTPTEYAAQVDNNSDFSSPTFDQSACTLGSTCPTASGIVATGLTNGTAYYVRVRAWRSGFGWGAWTAMTSPSFVTPAAAGSNYSSTWAAPSLIVHAQYNTESGTPVAAKEMQCTGGNPCTTNNQDLTEWRVPNLTGKPTVIGKIVAGSYAGVNGPLAYDSATGGAKSLDDGADHLAIHLCTAGNPCTTWSNTGTMWNQNEGGYLKLVRVVISSNTISQANFLSQSGSADVLWLNTSGFICIGDDASTESKCSTVRLPNGEWVVSAAHNGLTSGPKGHLYVYDVTSASDNTGACSSAVDGTLAAPTVYCSTAQGGYWAWETTSTVDAPGAGTNANTQMVLNGWSSTDGGAGNPGNGLGSGEGYYLNIIVAQSGASYLAPNFSSSPQTPNSLIVDMIKEMEFND